MILTNKEREKLHKAILSYLQSQGFSGSAELLEQEAGITGELGAPDILEKKWSSVVRLQQKIMSLQNELNSLKEEMSFYGPGKKLSDSNTRQEGLPRVPEKFTLSGHRDPVTCLVFHPVYAVLASASEDGSIRLWDYESGVFEKALKGHTGTVNSIAFEPNTGGLMASSSADLTIKLWNFETFECTKTLHGHDHNVSWVCFVPAGDFLLSASRDKSIKMWEVSTGFCTKTFREHSDWVRRVAINDSGSLFASCSNDETVMVWSIDGQQPMQVLAGHNNVVECVSFASANSAVTMQEADYRQRADEGKTPEFLASGSRDKTIRLWEVWSGNCLIVIRGHDNWVRQLIFHPNGKYLLSCSDDKSIRVWDLKNAACAKKMLDVHSHFVLCFGLNPRYPLLASGSVDKSIKIWECR